MYLMDALSSSVALMHWVNPSSAPEVDLNRHVLDIYPAVVEKLKGTPRFLLDTNTIHTAVELTLGRPKVLLEAMRHLRVPYERMWIEWPEEGRAKLRETFGDQGRIDEHRPLPARIGFLIEADKETGRTGRITWIWNGPPLLRPADFPNIAPISPVFDLDARIDQPSERIAGFLRGNLARIWKDNPVQLKALFDIWRTAKHEPSEWGWTYINHYQRTTGRLEQHLGDLFADVYGEYIIIWAIILLLTSSRKIVDYKPVSRAKINKARVKRREVPLLDHTEVTLDIGIRRVPGQTGQPLGYIRKSPRIHMVSSYLARRGDKHWVVMPYWRGSGETIHRQVKVFAPA